MSALDPRNLQAVEDSTNSKKSDSGRPELVVHPDIKLGRAHFRPVDDEPEPEETPKQRARRELKLRLAAELRAKEETGDTPTPRRGDASGIFSVADYNRRLRQH